MPIAFTPPVSDTPPEAEWVCTRSGRKFFPLTPAREQIAIEDIAYGLAGRYRFGSQSPRRYTVAQHSVEVCRWVHAHHGSSDACLWGLLHDAAEAWLVDWQRPVKWRQMWWDGEILIPFREIEDNILCVVATEFHLPFPAARLAQQGDLAQLRRERRDLFDGRQPVWENLPAISDEPPLPAILDPRAAEEEFLGEFYKWFNEK